MEPLLSSSLRSYRSTITGDHQLQTRVTTATHCYNALKPSSPSHTTDRPSFSACLEYFIFPVYDLCRLGVNFIHWGVGLLYQDVWYKHIRKACAIFYTSLLFPKALCLLSLFLSLNSPSLSRGLELFLLRKRFKLTCTI